MGFNTPEMFTEMTIEVQVCAPMLQKCLPNHNLGSSVRQKHMQIACAWQMHATNATLLPFCCYFCFKNMNHYFKQHFISDTIFAKKI